MENQIQTAWMNVLGRQATPQEIQDVKNSSGYWGTDANSIAQRLLSNEGFRNSPVNDEGIYRIFQAFLGNKPTPQEVQEIKSSWGNTLGDIADKLRSNPAFIQQGGVMKLGYSGTTPTGEPTNQAGTGRTPQTPVSTPQPYTKEQLRENAIRAGVSPETYDAMDEDTQRVWGGIGALTLENYKNTKQMPKVITPQTLQDMWEKSQQEANTNPFFDKRFQQDLENFQMGIAELQGDRTWIEKNAQKKFERDKLALDQEIANKGMTIGTIRQKAEELMKEEQSTILESTARDVEKNLQSKVKAFESVWGTEGLQKALPSVQNVLDPSKAGNFLGTFGITSQVGGRSIVAQPSKTAIGGSIEQEKANLALQNYQRDLQTQEALMNK